MLRQAQPLPTVGGMPSHAPTTIAGEAMPSLSSASSQQNATTSPIAQPTAFYTASYVQSQQQQQLQQQQLQQQQSYGAPQSPFQNPPPFPCINQTSQQRPRVHPRRRFSPLVTKKFLLSSLFSRYPTLTGRILRRQRWSIQLRSKRRRNVSAEKTDGNGGKLFKNMLHRDIKFFTLCCWTFNFC